jgi:hypothetical protein
LRVAYKLQGVGDATFERDQARLYRYPSHGQP